MSKRFTILAALLSGLGSIVAQSSVQAVVTAYVYPLTGEVRLSNDSATAFPIVFYDIFYTGDDPGGLNSSPSVWRSIADTYDASGNGFVDAVNQWVKISTDSRNLSEGLFNGVGTSNLPAARSISLGKIWNPSIVMASQLTVRVATDDQMNAVEIFVRPTLDGNYDGDDTVDMNDYIVWKSFFGSTLAPFADGNHNGVVDAADYTVWRDHLGQTLVGLPLGVGEGGGALTGSAAPEPTSAMLAGGMCGALLLWRLRRQR